MWTCNLRLDGRMTGRKEEHKIDITLWCDTKGSDAPSPSGVTVYVQKVNGTQP